MGTEKKQEGPSVNELAHAGVERIIDDYAADAELTDELALSNGSVLKADYADTRMPHTFCLSYSKGELSPDALASAVRRMLADGGDLYLSLREAKQFVKIWMEAEPESSETDAVADARADLSKI